MKRKKKGKISLPILELYDITHLENGSPDLFLQDISSFLACREWCEEQFFLLFFFNSLT